MPSYFSTRRGLQHPWEEANGVEDIDQDSPSVKGGNIIPNIMNSPGNPEPTLNPDNQMEAPEKRTSTIGQSEKITETIQNQQ